MSEAPVTALLKRLEQGDREAADALFRILYGDLRAQAARLMAGRVAGHTLQPTAVVNEAWMRLGTPAGGGFRSRAHFMGVAAKAMRSVLVDHARGRDRLKRGGGRERVALDEVLASYEGKGFDLLALDEALARFAGFDPALARLVELRFFGGLSIAETAEVLEVSAATVERHWRTAQLWLRAELGGDAP